MHRESQWGIQKDYLNNQNPEHRESVAKQYKQSKPKKRLSRLKVAAALGLTAIGGVGYASSRQGEHMPDAQADLEPSRPETLTVGIEKEIADQEQEQKFALLGANLVLKEMREGTATFLEANILYEGRNYPLSAITGLKQELLGMNAIQTSQKIIGKNGTKPEYQLIIDVAQEDGKYMTVKIRRPAAPGSTILIAEIDEPDAPGSFKSRVIKLEPGSLLDVESPGQEL